MVRGEFMYKEQKLAIDIGNNSIKMLFGCSKKILQAVSIRTPEKSIEDNRIVGIENIFNVINEYIFENNIKVRDVSFSLHGQDVVIRHNEIPIMEKKKLRESVEWEANQYLPDNGTNYYIDYEIIDKENTSEKKIYKLITVAVPKEKVEQYVILSKMLKLNLGAIDLASNCAARVFTNASRNGKRFKSVGIIDIGSRFSSIAILDSGKLFMEKEVPFGIEYLSREVSRRLHLDMEDSFKHFINNFDFEKTNPEEEMDRRIQELFDNACATFLKAIEFYTAGKIQKELDEIYVIGGGSKIKGVQSYLSRYFSSVVHIAGSPEKTGRKMKIPKDCDVSLYINTLGLLLRKE